MDNSSKNWCGTCLNKPCSSITCVLNPDDLWPSEYKGPLKVEMMMDAEKLAVKILGGLYPTSQDTADAVSLLQSAMDEVRQEACAPLIEALMGLKYYINNPSAWQHFDQSVSDVICQAVAVVDNDASATLSSVKDAQ